jgi:hypothetical protein
VGNGNPNIVMQFPIECQVWTSDLCSDLAHSISKVALKSKCNRSQSHLNTESIQEA